MRLLYFDMHGQLSITKDLIGNVPPYAILSHTWEAEEVTFLDLQNEHYKSMAGYTKILFCGQQARKDGIRHFWVDTCCIDKKNQPELTEAIVSMFRWYSNAVKCYVFLSDVGTLKRDHQGTQPSWESAFRTSRWFTRGWTLQELLAPTVVEFFTKEGKCLGDKRTLEQLIHEITTIPREALCGSSLTHFPVPERMRWAEKRVTTRTEDRAYCLLGIFDVYMSPIYGERENAFDRLKDEISRSYRRQLDEIRQPKDGFRSLELEFEAEMTQRDRLATLLDSLSFGQMDARRSTISIAHSDTCQWLLKHPTYLEWIDPSQAHQHHGFLWINGKPGVGKSTLLKFAHAQAIKEKDENEVIVSFFFNARGEKLEKSTTGMYRALLYQLLGQAPDLQTLLVNSYETYEHQTKSSGWTIELLCELFSIAVSGLDRRRLKCFIDALDECDEEQIQEMVYFFEDLGQSALEARNQLSVCFTSRHYPTIDIRCCQKLTLEDENGHSNDLVKYVRNHLHAGEGSYIEEVRKQVQEKANGIFIWAVLVVDILNKEFRRGRIFAVKQKLQEIPTKLSDLFKDILRRDSINRNDLLLCLQWILFAKRPLTREEFYFAMVAGLDLDCAGITEQDARHVTANDMDRFVLNSSKGLAELTKSTTPTVQFIHESVSDFLIRDNGLCELWPELRNDVYCTSHDRLKRCCQTYLDVIVPTYASHSARPKTSSEKIMKGLRRVSATKFPFLQYAHGHILYHADEAAPKIPQNDFLKQWPIKTWINFGNMGVQGDVRYHTSNASTLYLLAEYGFAKLIRTVCDNGPAMGVQGERYRYPLFAALTNGHREAVRALLSRYGDFLEGDIYEQLTSEKAFSIRTVRKDHTPFLWALERKHEVLAGILATCKDIDIGFKDDRGRNALSIAAENGCGNIVSLLVVTHGIDVNKSNCKDQKAPLSYAAQRGQYKVVKQLLQRNANIEAIDNDGATALHSATANKHETTLQLLLDEGADITAANNVGETALHIAAASGYMTIVRLLLDRGANINAVSKTSSTALQEAAANGHETVVRLLIQRGADSEATNILDKTAIQQPTKNDVKPVIQILKREHVEE